MRTKNDESNQTLALEFAKLIEKLLTQLDKMNQLDEIKAIVEERLEKIEEIVNTKSVDDYLDQFIPLEKSKR